MQKIETMLPVDSVGESECIRRDSALIVRSMSNGIDVDTNTKILPRESASYVRSSPTSVILELGSDDDEFEENIATKGHPPVLVQRIASALLMEELLLFLQRDSVKLFAGIAGWYTFGFIAVITTKLLLTTWAVPPLILTVQQLMISSTVLNILLQRRGEQGLQPWPSDKHIQLDFVLIGLFNALDFLASNCGFEGADASFVETIKGSEPITTTIVALSWKIDTLGPAEAGSLVLLFTGVLLSTLGNTQAESGDGEIESAALEASVRSTLTVMSANLCFAFRVLCQKRYRGSATASDQLDNTNLLYRMQTTGWMILLLPAILNHYTYVSGGLSAPMDHQTGYLVDGNQLLTANACHVGDLFRLWGHPVDGQHIWDFHLLYGLCSVYRLSQSATDGAHGRQSKVVQCIVFGEVVGSG
eukprot:scaffold426_cov219-Amphora_coffeaeformis.AAC.6